MTLCELLFSKGIIYTSNFKTRAEDISFNSNEELFESLGYILSHVKRIDFETPSDHKIELANNASNYTIENGTTTGGHQMKYASQYRIYLSNINNIPLKLRNRLQKDSQMRITGTLFIEACKCLGFKHGSQQDIDAIYNYITQFLISTCSEQAALDRGYNL